jgi:hypothetical protein
VTLSVLEAVGLLPPEYAYAPLDHRPSAAWLLIDAGTNALNFDKDEVASLPLTLAALRETGAICRRENALLLHLHQINHPVLNASWSVYEATHEQPSAWFELMDTFRRILKAHEPANFLFSTTVRTLFEKCALSRAERDYLLLLLRQDADQEVSAVFEDFERSRDVLKFLDQVLPIAGRWRERSPHKNVLGLIDDLFAEDRISMEHTEVLETKIFHADPVLLGAFGVLQEEDLGEEAWQEFLDTISRILFCEEARRRQQHLGQAMECINMLSSVHEIMPMQRDVLMRGVASEDPALLDIFDKYEDTQDVYELFDNLIKSAGGDNDHQVTSEQWRAPDEAIPNDGEEDSHERLMRMATAWVEVAHTFSPADKMYIRGLLARADPVLLSIFAEAEESDDHGYFNNSLSHLCRRWEQKHSSLLQLIRGMKERTTISLEFAEGLELMVLEEDEVLLAAFDLFAEGSRDPNTKRMAYAEFLETLAFLQQRVATTDPETGHTDAIPPELPTSSPLLRELLDNFLQDHIIQATEHAYLHDLTNSSDVRLEAAFTEYQRTGDLVEFEDTVVRLGIRWTQYCTHTDLLKYLASLSTRGMICNDEYEHLQKLVYDEDEVLLEAPDEPEQRWAVVQELLDQNYESKCADATSDAEHWITSLWRHFNVPSSDLLYLFELARTEDPVFFAALQTMGELERESNVTDASDMLDTLTRLGSRWRTDLDATAGSAMFLLDYLLSNEFVSNGDCDILEVHIHTHTCSRTPHTQTYMHRCTYTHTHIFAHTVRCLCSAAMRPFWQLWSTTWSTRHQQRKRLGLMFGTRYS